VAWGTNCLQMGKQFELVVPNHCRVKWTRSCYQHYETTHVDKLKASGSHRRCPPRVATAPASKDSCVRCVGRCSVESPHRTAQIPVAHRLVWRT
jgi:hypothetical protein